MIEFPISSGALRSVFGLAFLIAVIVQIAKLFIRETRALNLVALAAGLLFGVGAALVDTGFQPTGEDMFSAVVVAIFAVGLATVGYETIANLAGLVGVGPKSDVSRLEKARERVLQADIRDARDSWLK